MHSLERLELSGIDLKRYMSGKFIKFSLFGSAAFSKLWIKGY